MNSDAMADQVALIRDVISFGPFRLAVGERLLTRDGARVELGGRALDLLIAFATHPNEAMDKGRWSRRSGLT